MRRLCLLLICIIVICMAVSCSKKEEAPEVQSTDTSYLEYEHNPGERGGATAEKKSPGNNTTVEKVNNTPKKEDTSGDEKTAGEGEENQNSDKKVTVSVSSVNIRTAPSLDAEIVDNVKWGTELSMVEKGETWSKIRYEDRLLYVYTAYVSDKEE